MCNLYSMTRVATLSGRQQVSMRSLLAFAVILFSWLPAIAADEKVVEDCDYWLLGKDDAERAERLKACDRVITGKGFSKANRALAYAEKASAASRNTRNDEAIAALDQSLALEPDNLGRRQDRAFLLHHKGEHDKAIADFDKILAASPSEDFVTYYRGLSYLAKGDEHRAFADMARGIELAPKHAWYYYWRARLYAERKHDEAALADIDKALELEPGDDAYLLRAELYTRNNEVGKAIADLTRAAELNPTYPIPISNRALLYEQRKQYDLALADYDKLISLRPGDTYYTERKAALLGSLATEPEPIILQPEPPSAQPSAPLEVESKPIDPAPPPAPTPGVTPKPKPKVAGQGECRRYDPIANLTISVACPE
jgi:tetratricopeptide (TPR) repeat protein